MANYSISSKVNLTYITNCQGPTLVNRFARVGSQRFQKEFEVLFTPQIQRTSDSDLPEIFSAFDKSDAIVAQPFPNSKFESLKPEALRCYARDNGKKIIFFPALHFLGIIPSLQTPKIKNPGFPFGSSEDVVLRCLYLRNCSPHDAAELYHDGDFYSDAELTEGVTKSIGEFEKREEAFDTEITMSGFYRENWRTSRLHYVKSHPTATVYAHLVRKLLERLDIHDMDEDRIAGLMGNSFYSLPIMRSVKRRLNLSFEDDEYVGLLNKEPTDFSDIIGKFFAYYDTLDKDALEQSTAHEMPGLLTAVRAL